MGKKIGSTCFCIDYRKLNKLNIQDAYSLPRIDQSFDNLSGNKWFSILDLWVLAGIGQARGPTKTAFITRKGSYQFKNMPFGLSCAPATFQRLMEKVMTMGHNYASFT